MSIVASQGGHLVIHSISAIITMLGLVLCVLHPSSAEADDLALPNHPPLLRPDKDCVIVGGLPPGESRVWKERVFSDGDGLTTALCAEDLTLQPIFPAAAPARGAGVLCLADLPLPGSKELTATVYLSGRLIGSSRQVVVQPDCRIFVAEGSAAVQAVNDDGAPLYLHVFTCRSDGMRGTLIGRFLTTGLEEGGLYASFDDDGIDDVGLFVPDDTGVCDECDPVECDPCCASCPD
jgi:hypothetical protein